MTKQTRTFLCVLTMGLLFPSIVFAQTTREEYIQQYKNFAVREMRRTGIPASITMAQALLESDNGNSKLARRANNHFGIKCGGNWDGKTFHQDDDAKHECFRKYREVEDSYKDHSAFLQKDRYAELFKLSSSDYKEWARGLKKAGYATNPKYPTLLIKLIDDNKLYELDLCYKEEKEAESSKPETKIEKPESKPQAQEPEFTIGPKQHEVKLNNRVKYIEIKAGDTFKSLKEEFDLMAWQLPKYNEMPDDADLVEGQVLYLQPKRNKAEVGNDFHKVEAGESMYDISQKYAIKLSKLYQLNLMPEGTQPKEGSKLTLRKTRK
ncbi:MAG: glucosaminidase domain-containing protein [Bacteroidales bacterium]|nr:glucosaminidase domain-containing protein [Bacteroidales bacterium]MCF8458282.1 glucosaminidase domain-containing protein [Bacteroidales bacterium]